MREALLRADVIDRRPPRELSSLISLRSLLVRYRHYRKLERSVILARNLPPPPPPVASPKSHSLNIRCAATSGALIYML